MKATVLIGAIGLALGSGVGYHTIYVSKLEQARLIRVKIAQTKADQQAQEDVATLLQRIEQYRKRLAPSPEPSWLSREVVELAHNAGLELTTINPGTPEELPQFTRLNLSVQFSSTYHKLGTLLDMIERAPYFIRVDRLTVGGLNETNGQASIGLTLSTLYVAPAVPQAVSVSSRAP